MAMSASVPDKVTNMPNGRPFFHSKWLSHTSLHLQEAHAFRELGLTIEAVANRLVNRGDADRLLRIDSMWSIVSRSGMQGERHNHKGVVSAAYYVDAGTSGDSSGGNLQFYVEKAGSAPSHVVTPRAGLLVLFPSSLHHSVSRYTGEDPRIVISANLK